MKTPFKLAILGTALATVSAAALAANSAEITVTGNLVWPACSISLSNNGTIDFGTIDIGGLNQTTQNVLPGKDLTATLTCSGATRLALRALDNRNDSVSTTVNLAMRQFTFGLGKVGTKTLGAYALMVGALPTTIDGARSSAILYSINAGSTWSSIPQAGLQSDGGNLVSWYVGDTATPSAGSTLVVPLRVNAVLNSVANLPTTSEGIQLDGLITLSMIYL